MSRLRTRMAALERRINPPALNSWIRIIQWDGQTQEDALAAWEAENGPLSASNVCLRVIIRKPRPTDLTLGDVQCPA